MSGSVIKNVEEFDGKHNFLAEELLVPMANRVDVARLNMFCSHISQTVVLNTPERPRVFTRFENAFGRYTTAVKIAPDRAKILSVFEKSPLQRVYALQFEDGRVGIHFGSPARHLTENYGYLLDNSPLEGAEAGDEIEAGTVLQSWPCHDEQGNFQYGVNLRTVYMNLEGLTYEDGLVISESAAERMSHTSIEKVTVNLNANDLTVNLYGDDPENYQGFPEIGQEIRGGVLMARRRINHESIIYDLATPMLNRINWDADTVFYAEGTVVDIEVFSNLSESDLDKHPYNRQILEHHRRWIAFRDWFTETLSPYVTGEAGAYTEDVAYWHKVCRDSALGPWRKDKSEFDGVVIRFTVAKDNPLSVGSKITNRMGGKGVVAQIRPDDQMPVTEDGRRADLAVNSLGVVNRLNPAQLYESELNYIADAVVQQMRGIVSNTHVLLDAYDHMLSFLDLVSPQQAEWMRENVSTEEAAVLVDEIIEEREPIYIHQPPFYGVVELGKLREAYEVFGVGKAKFVGIEEPMILGTNYYMKLRHEPSSKFSARSAKHLSIAGVPAKNSRGVRTNTEHHSATPIRLGEQEIQNLLIANEPGELSRFLSTYATDDVSREGAIVQMMLRPDPFSEERIVTEGSQMSRPVAGLHALLESIGLQLTGDADQQPTSEEESNG